MRDEPTRRVDRAQAHVHQRAHEAMISFEKYALELRARGDRQDVDEVPQVAPDRAADGGVVVEDEERHARPIDRYPDPVAKDRHRPTG